MKSAQSMKERLIAQSVQRKLKRHERREGDAGCSFPGKAMGRRRTDFREHPGWQQLNVMREGAKTLGVDDPFFRVHEGCSGATAIIEGRECLNFASYNYLGLNGDARVIEAAQQAAADYGVSVSASRMVSGERPVHRQLEQALARVYHSDDALAFVSGHATNVSVVGYLMGNRDLILHDEYIHNSSLMGAQLSGARRMAFRHNNLEHLEKLLQQHRHQFERVLIVVEGLYSMDGDTPDLSALTTLKDAHDSWLMVDEAHALGVLGATGQGSHEHADVDPHRVDIWMGTLSKTLSGCGGYIAGSQPLIDLLRHFAPGFLYIENELVTLTDAELYSTPMDTLSVRNITGKDDLGHPIGHPHQALNVLRLLQTMDGNADESIITIPDSFHSDRSDETVMGLNFALNTLEFAGSTEVDTILSIASKNEVDLVDRSEAVDHLEQTLAGLEKNVIDLRGTWVGTSTYLAEFGGTPDPSCVDAGSATWIVGDETVFLYGDELNSETDENNNITCNTVEYGSQEPSDDSPGEKATRDGETGVEWLIADNGALDFDCGPTCTLAELRGTIDDWDARCLADAFYENNSEGSPYSSGDTAYCAESDDHNGPIVGYSEVTYIDRLGGDRILRLKWDFYASSNEAPAQTAERATDFNENGFFLEVMNRKRALDHTLDLTQGEWVEKVNSATDQQTVDGGTYTFPTDGASIALECAAGFESCTWEELNGSYDDGSGNTVQYIYIRGTDVINWVEGDTVGTLTLAASS